MNEKIYIVWLFKTGSDFLTRIFKSSESAIQCVSQYVPEAEKDKVEETFRKDISKKGEAYWCGTEFSFLVDEHVLEP